MARAATPAVLIAVALTLSATACSAGTPTNTGPYTSEIEQAGRDATSDFERQVFSDGQISRKEYDESADRYIRCLNDNGLSASTELQDGLNTYAIQYPPGTTNASEAESRCAVGTTILIEPLYGNILLNPDNVDFDELVVDCLKRNGIVDQDYTKADLLQETRDSPTFYPEDPAGMECLAKPNG